MVAIALVGCGAEPQSNAPSAAEKLAQLDAGAPVEEDAPEVARFQRRLDQMTMKCGVGEMEIADMTVRAQELLADAGRRQSLYRVITGVNRGADARDGGVPCIETYGRYVTIQNQLP